MDVVNLNKLESQRKRAVAVMALERVPSDIRAGGVARSANPKIVEEVMNALFQFQ